MDIEGMAAVVAKWSSKQPLIRKVYLFGSRVRGTHKTSSDLDVAVEIFTMQGDSCPFTTWTCEVQRFKASIAGIVPVIIDLNWYGGPEKTPLIHAALEASSVVIYDVHDCANYQVNLNERRL